MKNIVKLFILFIISTLVFWGCGSSTQPDPEPENEEVVNLLTDGMWEKVDSTGVVVDTTDRRGRFKYNRDHTGDVYMLWEDEWILVMSFNWRLEDNSTKLVLSSQSDSGSARIEKLTEMELILYWIEDEKMDFYIKVQD